MFCFQYNSAIHHEYMLKNLLTDVGFAPKEAEIYLALLHAGPQPASVIARKICYNRITTYQILMELVRKGLVSVVLRANVKYFSAERPERILSFLENQRVKHEDSCQAFKSRIHMFHQLVNPENVAPIVRSFNGINGIYSIYEDTLESDCSLCLIHDFGSAENELRDYLLNNYIPRRVKKGISCRVILPKNKKNKIFAEMDKKDLRHIRYISPKELSFDTAILLYSGKTAIVSYKQNEQFGTIIESSSFHATMTEMFEVLWRKGELPL